MRLVPKPREAVEEYLGGSWRGYAEDVARAAGMTVWGFTGGSHADDNLEARLRKAGAHDVLPDFAAVRARL